MVLHSKQAWKDCPGANSQAYFDWPSLTNKKVFNADTRYLKVGYLRRLKKRRLRLETILNFLNGTKLFPGSDDVFIPQFLPWLLLVSSVFKRTCRRNICFYFQVFAATEQCLTATTKCAAYQSVHATENKSCFSPRWRKSKQGSML